MIDPVTLDQQHFRIPTLRTDARGLVIGERALLRFSILPQVVSFFQALSGEQSLDHMSQSLRIVKVKSRTTGLELVVDMPAQGSYLLDRAAKIARLLKGQAYTGNWPHFVPYRDRAAPFGYDARELVSWADGPAFYSQHGAQKLTLSGEMSFAALISDLSLSRVKPPELSTCVVRVVAGLRSSLQSFLWRRSIKASVAEVVRVPHGRFSHEETVYLFRLEETPHHLFSLFEEMPGVEVYHSHGRNLFVERGYRHPFAIENCRRFFSDEHLHFFSGSRDQVDVIDGDALTYVAIGDLQAQRFRLPVRNEIQKTGSLIGKPDAVYRGQALGQAVEYKVNIVHVPGGRSEHVTGVLIQEASEIAWLKRIVYSLPQSALDNYRAAFTEHGVVVLCSAGVELIPLGQNLKEVFPSVYLPVGKRFSPPLSYEHLRRALSMERGNVYLLPFGIARPLEIPEAIIQPLVRYLLADVDIQTATNLAPQAERDRERGIPMKSAEAGLFSLWKQNILKPSIMGSRAALPGSSGEPDNG